MKTSILKSLLILVLLLAGYKSAQAATIVNDITTIGSSTIYQGQTLIPVAGTSVQSTNGTTINLNSLTFTINKSLTGIFSNIQLVTSPTGTFNPLNYTLVETPTGQTATTITFGGIGDQIRNSTSYYYVLVDYTGTTTNTTVNFTPAQYNGNTINNVNTNTFTLRPPFVTATFNNGGLAGLTQAASNPALAVYGVSLASTGTSTFTGLTFGTTTTATNINAVFSSVTLYSSTSATWTTSTAPGVTSLSTINNPTGTSLAFTGLPTQTITNGNTLYYFLVANYVEPATTYTLRVNTPTLTGTGGTTLTGTATGQTYTFNAPSVTETAITAGLTNPTTLYSSQNAIPVFGMQVKASGAASFTALTFNASSTISPNYQNVTLYSSSNNTFDGTATAVSGATYTSTTTSVTATLPSTQSLADGTSIYYYLVVDYNEPATTVTQKFTAGTIAGTTVNGTAAAGPTYTLTAPSIAETTVAATGLTNPTTLVLSQTGIPVFGMQVKSTGTSTFTALTFNASSTISPNYQNVTLYSSSNPTFDGSATATGATYTSTATSITATLPAAQTLNNGGTIYYYLVVDYYEPTITTVNQTFTAGTVAGATVTGSNAVGPTYTLTAPSVAETTIAATGLTNPTTLISNATGIPVFGMALKATGNVSFTALTFNASSTISPNYQNVTLYSSSNNTFDGTATAVSGATYTSTATSVTATLPSAQTITNGSTLYYYLVVDYTVPATTVTQTITAGTITGTTVTGSAAVGPTYTLTAPSVALAAITAGLAPTTLYSSQTTLPVFGMSLTATGTPSFTALTFNASSSPISPNFQNVTLYSSSSNTFDGTAAAVSGVTYTNTATSVTATLPSAQTMTNGSVLYYYLVVDYTEPPTTNATQKFTAGTITGSNVTGAAAGQTYTLTAPSVAETTVAATGLTNPTTLYSSQNTIPVFGMQLKSTGTSTFTALKFNFSATIAPNYTGVTLYSSSNATFDGTATAVSGATYTSTTTSVTATLPSAQTLANNATIYYYIVVNYVEPATTTSTQTITASTITGANVPGASAVGPTYTLTAPSLTQALVTAGLTGTNLPLTLNQTNLAMFGMSLKSTGTSSFTSVSFTATQNIAAYFSGNVTLYSSTSATFPGVGSPSLTLLQAVAVPNSTNIVFNSIPTQTIGNNVTTYYYLVVDGYNPPTTPTTFEWDLSATTPISGGTITTTNVTYGDKTGQPYTLNSATLVQAQDNNGLTGTTLPLTLNQTNLALYGMSLRSTGTSSFTGMNFTATRTINAYFGGNVNLYATTTATWPGVGSATLLSTVPAPGTTNVAFTFPTQTIGNGVTMYYWIVMDSYSPPITSTTFQFNVPNVALTGGTMNATNSTVTYGDQSGQSYTLTAATMVENQVIAGLTATTINGVQNNIALYGMSLKSTGTSSFTTMGFTATRNISTYFTGNISLYSSTSNTWSGTGSATLLQSQVIPNSTAVTFTFPTQTIGSGVTMYYYVVLDANKIPTTSTTFELDLNTTAPLSGGTMNGTNSTVTYNDKTGQQYTLNPAVSLGTASTSGLDPNPLNVSQTGGILGFAVTTYQNLTFTQFNLTASVNVNTYFSNVKLYSSTSNSFASATPVSGTPTISALNSTTLTISGLSQNVNSTTVYYFIVADFTLPATDGTFRLTANSVQTATTTYTNGGPIAGTLYNCGPQSVDWIGGTTGSLTDWNTASNWYQGVVPGPLDDVNIGVNRAYITSTKTNNPIISAAETVTVASITFGSIESQHTVNYKYGTEQLMSLQVDGALTVTGDITQNHSVSAAGIKTNYLITTLKGNGTISCQNFYVGDLTEPANTVADIAQVSIQVFHLTINGNVILNSNGNGVTGTSGNKGICYPWFSLEKGTTTIYGTVNFNKNFFPYEDAFDIYNPSSPGVSEIHWPDYALFTCDNTASSPSTLELLNKNAFPSTGGIQGYHTYFTYGGNNGTVLYDDPNAEQQTIYSSNDLSTNAGSVSQTSNWPAYYNLSFNGTSTKLVNKDNSAGLSTAGLTIAGAWETDGGQVKLGQNPTITTGSTWTNTAQITHAAGSITVGGMFTNTTLADASGNVACGTGTITFKGGYTNNTTFTPSATGIINFSPTTSETITDNSTNGTIFNIVNFTSGTTTIQPGTSGIGNIGVSAAGVLTMSGSSTLVGGTTTSGGVGYLTLMSNASGTATVYTPTGTKITGNVNVQRWVTGGAGTRGYRLFSSPVNASLSYTGGGNLSLGYLGANGQFASTTYLGAFTEGPGTGFTYNGSTNPIIYLYDETRPTNNTGFTSGKNIGVYSITGNTVTTLTNGVQQAGVNVPVGNSYLLYYVGDNHLTDQTAVTGTRIPESTAVTATGYLNQSNVPVYFWKLNTTTIPYDVNGGNLPGLNQVGNPYPATISLAALYNQNIAAPYNSNISPIFWELDPTSGISGTYISYNALSHTTSTGTGRASSDLIVEGQGFLVQALGSTSTLTFTEAQKVPYASTSGSTLLMSIPTTVAQHDITSQPLAQSVVPAAATNINSQSLAQSVVPAAATNINSQSLAQSDANFNTAASLQSTLNGLHLQLSNGTAYTQTGIYFGSQWSDAYSPYEDAIDLDGTSPKVWLSSYTSDGKRVSINELGDYSNGKKVKLFVGSSASGNFTMSLVDIQNIDTADYNVFLYDRKLNDSVDIRRSKSYNFTINNSDTTTWGANRFVLIIENSISGPYALTSFSGAKVSNGVSLTWTTINAGGHINYVLQRKNANGNYNNIYTTQSNGNNLYNYVDTRPNLGKNIYRLKQTDNNGNVSYSNLLNFDYDFTTPTGSLTIYPNPSSSIINMNLVVTDNTVPANYTAIIYNSSGGIAKKTKVNSNTWTENISSFKLGMYILNITDANGNLVGQSKFIKVE